MYPVREYFPDKTPIDRWFYEIRIPSLEELGTQYVLTQHGIYDDGKIYTKEIQALIDTAHENGGGVIIVPQGTYITGSLFFKQGVNLYVSEGGVLKGSGDVCDYELKMTRIEGESCLYFAALINADGVDGFTMCGPCLLYTSSLYTFPNSAVFENPPLAAAVKKKPWYYTGRRSGLRYPGSGPFGLRKNALWPPPGGKGGTEWSFPRRDCSWNRSRRCSGHTICPISSYTDTYWW